MKNTALLVFLLLGIFSLTAQTQVMRNVSDFDRVYVAGIMDVKLKKGDKQEIYIETDGISNDKVSAFVKGGELKVKILESLVRESARIEVTIVYTELRALTAFAGAEVTAKNTIEADHFKVKASSGATIDIDVLANTIDAHVSEGGELEVNGTTDNQYVKAITGGQYDGLSLEANHTEVRATTGGEAEIQASDRLEAKATLGGFIYYKGQPTVLELDSGIGGTIKRYNRSSHNNSSSNHSGRSREY